MQDTITSLRQLASTVRLAGAQHRQERVQRFKGLDRNKEMVLLFERCARQKVDHLFPNASETLRNRMAESIATRRARFLYLEMHQKKTSTLNQPVPELQQNDIAHGDEDVGQDESGPSTGSEQQQTTNLVLRPTLKPRVQQSEILSNTVNTKLDPQRLEPTPNKRAESVSSVKISTNAFPPRPKLDPTGTSFSCPYCFMICPAKEISGQREWM